ncbi:hypothetical protein sos41_26580 [Alphaproteobacteria bacterium SO-S41]|nr:hypothetical protein sos41_26580 [Alphaproteobacteria bacterium SO-S41]
MRLEIGLIAALGLGGSAMAGARQDATVIMPENEKVRKIHEDWGFSEAVIAGDTAYLSGVVVGLRPGETDLETAYTRAFDQIGGILKRAGLSWDDVVEITSYHTDVKAQMEAMIAVKHRYIAAPFPAWTAIQIVRLIPDSGITEIRITAKKRG